MDKTKAENAMNELTLLLMYLSRFSQKDRFTEMENLAWKGYDFDVINELDEEDYIRQGSHRSKSVAITDKGVKQAQKLMEKYHIEDWK
jgi:predicted transcriptional regulator